MDWTVLGIAPTKDKKTIRDAYLACLSSVNPEDKPEEFKSLRAAYEEAMRLADEEEKIPERDESPTGLWMERVRALYADFPARIRPENWKELLNDEVCIALDKRPLAEEALLKFLMDDYYVPQSVWILFDGTFSWSERREELYEHYPRDFVDYAVLNGIRYSDTLPYDLFEPGINAADCDRYRQLYYQANRTAFAELASILEQLFALSEWHPYGQALKCLCMIQNGQAEEGCEGLRKLAETYPNNVTLVMDWAVQCVNSENWAEGELLTRHVLELEPEHGRAKRLLADCLAKTDRQEEAKDLIYELMHAAGGDRKASYQLNQVVQELNQSLIQRWEAHMAENPDDHKTALELGWCYLQNDRSDDALAICERIDPDYEDSYDYHNLYAKTCYGHQDFEGALEHLEVIEKILRKMQPDGTKETEKRLSRLPEVLQIQGSCLYALGRRDETMEKYEQAVHMAPDDPEILTQTAHLLLNQKNYERAAEVSRKVTELMPGSYHGYFLLSDALHELRRDRDAFHAVNRALELDGSDLAVYVLKMRILLRNGVWDGVRETLDFLHENGITDALSVLWCEAQLAEFADQNKEKAWEMYQMISERLEKGEELPWAAQLYFRMTVLMADKLRKPEDRPKLLAMLEQGLGYDPDDEECLDYKAWLLAREERVEEAIAIYHKLETVPNHSLNVERELAQLYYKDLGRNAEEALHYYQMLLDNEESDVLHFYAGMCRRYLKDFAGAEANFLRERAMAPDDIDAYRGLSYVYEAMGRYEDALENTEQVIKLRKNVEGDQSEYYFRKIQILRRLERYQEAIQTVDEVTSIYGCESAEKMKFDIYCQFGLWAKARQYLKEWKRSNRKLDFQHGAEVKLDILMGEYKKARAALAKDAKKFNLSDYQYLQLAMAELDGDTTVELRNWKEREDYSDYVLMNIAQACWWRGNYELARKCAQRAVEQQEEMLKRHTMHEALYRSRRALMIAILGREEEAKEELAKVRRLPLCEDCNYCRCKDADIYEANIEEICGRYDKAMRLYIAGMEKWPDDLDFAAGLRRIKRRKGIL